MSRKEVSLEERQKIKNTLKETKARRKTQIIKVFELKVNCHHTSKETYKEIKECFKQAKWAYNDMLNFGEENDIFKYEYKDHKEITRLDKDGNKIIENLNFPCVFHRGIVKQLKTNISNLSKAKKKGLKVGALKYVSEINSIPIITGFIKIKDKKHITIPSFKNLCVYGLDQLDKYDDYEIADGRLVRRASGIYVMISVCINKDYFKSEKTNKTVGLDFGIRKNITTSDGEKFNCNMLESEQLKFLQKQLHRKKEGSKRYYRLLNQIRREYEHLSNKKTDASNKLIHYLRTNYDVIYFQDEQITNWKKKKRNKKNGKVNNRLSFGRQIQHSYLGRVKSKLVLMEKEGKSFKMSKWLPTTKFCPCCGALNDIGDEETYVCECGYTEDRDVHASKNVKLFGSTKRAECLEQTSAEVLATTCLNLCCSDEQVDIDEAKTKKQFTREEFIETYQLEDDCMILEPWEDFKGGIVGVTEDRTQIIYSYQGMVESLARSYEKEYYEQHKDEEYDSDRFSEFLDEAVQWIDYNTLRSLPYCDINRRPIIMMETEI